MAFSYTNSKGTTYYLHASTRTLKSGKEQKLYFFAKSERENSLGAVPAGYEAHVAVDEQGVFLALIEGLDFMPRPAHAAAFQRGDVDKADIGG